MSKFDYIEPSSDAVSAYKESPFEYADFGKRTLAFLLDGVIQCFMMVGVGIFANILPIPDIITGLLAAISLVAYSIGFEASSQQATPGKRALGLKVGRRDGSRISLGQSAGRWFMKFAGSLGITGGIGFIAAALTKNNQALHDLTAGTFVFSDEPRLASMLPQNTISLLSNRNLATLEKVILQIAYKHQGIVTPAIITLESPDEMLSLAEAEGHLQRLANRGICSMELNSGGRIEYHFPEFMP